MLWVNANSATFSGVVNVTGANIFGPVSGSTEFAGNYICTNNVLTILGGAVSFDGAAIVSPSVINLSNGSLGGSNLVTVGNAMTWTGGSMLGTGRTLISPGAILNISNSSAIFITSRTLDNAGTVTWTGAGLLSMNGGVVTNRPSALFNVQSATTVQFGGGSPRFDNAGVFRKSVSPGTFTFGQVPLTNYGIVDIQSGVLSAYLGGYGSSSNAVLNCALAGTTPGTNYGQLQVGGSVTLNGTLSINLANSFVPATNASFTLVSAGSRNGTFSNFAYPSNQLSMVLTNTTTAVIAIVANVVVPPAQLILHLTALSPASGLLYWSTNFTSYSLQSNALLGTTNWATVRPTPVVVGTNFVVTNSFSGQGFYRLSSGSTN